MILANILHYFSAILAISLGALGGGIAQGIAGSGTVFSLLRQPMSHDDDSKAMVIGLALIESGVIIALVSTLAMLVGGSGTISIEASLAEIGIALAVGSAAFSISLASSQIVKASTNAISRQPLFASKIFTFMLLTQSVISAPIIFAFIIGLIIKSNIVVGMSITQGIKLLISGLVFAIGCIGPVIGQAIFAKAACTSVGLNKNAYNKIFPFTLISEAVIETPVIFCLLFSFIILFTKIPNEATNILAPCTILFAAMICLCFGTFGASMAMGKILAQGCTQITINENAYGTILRSSLLAVAFVESTLIYALIIALLLITKISGG